MRDCTTESEACRCDVCGGYYGMETSTDDRCPFCEAKRLESEIAGLRATAAKLPETADGVLVLPGMTPC